MALILDKVLQTSISVNLAAGQSKLLSPGRRLSRRTHCRTTRKIGVVCSVQSDVQTKESLTTGNGRNNGSSSYFPATSLVTTDASISVSNLWVAHGPVNLEAYVTIRRTIRPTLQEKMAARMDALADSLGKKITLQLVSVDSDPETGTKLSEVSPIEGWGGSKSVVADKMVYTVKFSLGSGFGLPGALIITNKHKSEFFLESVSLLGHPTGAVHFPTYSWVASDQDNPVPRVFFSNQVYLPSSTPKGLQDLREQDLKSYRGDGQGERKAWENIYDFDLYNDLDDVDKDSTLARPILGGSKEFQYPRRGRTGRPAMKTDPSRESRIADPATPYVPRDENFEPIKQESFISTSIKGLVQQTVPGIAESLLEAPDEFESFEGIDQLYWNGLSIRRKKKIKAGGFGDILRSLPLFKKLPTVHDVVETVRGLDIFQLLPAAVQGIIVSITEDPATTLRYPLPKIISRDRFAWLQDDEFARQTLSGLNPCAIERLKVFPPVSALDNVELYGPRESAIKRHHIEGSLEGLTIEKALEEGKLFILDYHDVFLPYINRINELEGRKGYATRTLFFLTKVGTLSPLAIELSLPLDNPSCHPGSQVYVPGDSSTDQWLWRFAKAHVCSNDSGYHQLVSHFLRTHASVEPYVIATNRQLSPLHPIFRVLHPHLRYTMQINAAARQSLICADGVIEKTFLPGKYSMEMSSAVYGGSWRFDKQGLPEELLSRGMAVEEGKSETGVKIVIEDYPYANDGLIVWSAIKSWVTEYVSIYYKKPETIQQDEELQKWWEEIRIVGHADKKDEKWWPQLQTEADLIQILTTMIWVGSGLHAAVNFGQYDYGGYVPNRPTLMRQLLPQPGTAEYEEFLCSPQAFFLKSLPSQTQATVLMAVIESLSTHSPDEEYLGSDTYPHWYGCPEALAAYERFQEKMLQVELEIRKRNGDPKLLNRNGAGTLPYELLLPTSKPGITARGVPNSISI